MSSPLPLHSVGSSATFGSAAPRVLTALGALVFLVGLFVSPAGVWPNYLLAVFGLACSGLAGAVFVALHHVTGARWGSAILRVPEAMLGILPFAAGATAVLAFGAPTLYAWADHATVAGDEILEGRAAWMNVPFVLARAAFCYLVWIGLGSLLVRRSRRAVERGDDASRAAAARAGVWFLLAFAPTFSVACFDWVLSLDRHFASTMFALYHFAGLFLSGVALVTILVIVARRQGSLSASAVTEDVLHDLGKLLFAFTLMWGYLWFSQFMLIWYTNMPEETAYYVGRHAGGFAPLAVANVLLNWTVPFLLLLPRSMKRNDAVLLRVASLVLVGRWLDLYLGIDQPSQGATPVFGLWEIGLAVGAAGAFLWSWRRTWTNRSTGPTQEPVEVAGGAAGDTRFGLEGRTR